MPHSVSIKKLVITATLMSLMFFSHAAISQDYWQSIGAGHANVVNKIEVDANGALYVATDLTGLYKSTDGGASYQSINNGITNYDVADIVIHPNSTNTLLAGTRGGIFKSLDGGSSWAVKRDGIGGPVSSSFTAPISDIVYDLDDSSIVFAAVGLPRKDLSGNIWTSVTHKATIFKSIDGGDNWDPTMEISLSGGIAPDASVYKLVFGAVVITNGNNFREMYVATQYGVHKSVDGGTTWIAKNQDLPVNQAVRELLIDVANSSTIYATIKNGTVYRSENSGDNWALYNDNLVTSGKISYYRLAQNDQGQLYVTGNPDSNAFKKGVWRIDTTDSLANWEYLARMGSGGNITHAWYGDSVKVTSVVIDPSDASNNTIYFSGSTTLYKSTDAGLAWQQIYSLENNGKFSERGINSNGACHSLVIDPTDTNIILADSGDHGLLKSVDAGESWARSGQGMIYNKHIYDILIDADQGSALYVSDSERETSNRGTVSKSIDQGDTWAPININLPDKTVYALALDSTSDSANRTLYAGLQNAGIYRSLNDGQSWENYSGPSLGSHSVKRLIESPLEASVIYAAVLGTSTNLGGLYKRSDSDPDWIKVNPDQDFYHVYDVAIDPNNPGTIYIATRRKHVMSTNTTYAAGVWKNTRGGIGEWDKVIADPQWVPSIAIDPAREETILAATRTDNFFDAATGTGIRRFSENSSGLFEEELTENIPVRTFERVAYHPTVPERTYTCVQGSGVYTHSDLAGYWSLEENEGFPLRDISGNEHHATTFGNPVRVSGKVGQDGLSFDTSSHLVADNVALDANSSFSISAWVKPDSHGQWAPIVYSNSSGSAGFRFYTTTNRIQFTLRDETSSFKNVISDTSLVNGVWSLVTAVYDVTGTNMHLYINGQLDKTTLGVGNLDANFYNGASMFSQIGGGDNNPDRFFQGSLDDIRIYNIALTQSNVNRLYARGTLVGHWQLEQDIGDISKDVSDYNNVANVLGAPIWIQGAIDNKALHFDAGDAMNMENIPLHADASFTISVWVNPATRNALAPILYSGAGEESGFRFHSSGGKIQFTLRNSNPDINLSLKTVVSSAELLTDEWSLVTGVYDINNDSMFLYINGVEVGTTSSIGTLDASYYDGSVTFSQVGGGHTDPDKTFAGSLDNIRIVNRALSAAEVFVLSNQIDRLTDTDNDTVTDIYDNCVSMVNADQLNTDGDANGNECDTDDDNDGLLDDLELLIGTNSLLIDTDADGLSDFDEVNFDGDPTQYIPGQDLDPLLKDTDGDSFDDGVEILAGSDPLNSSSVPAISAPVLNLLGFLGILIGVLAIGAKRIRANYILSRF